MTRSACLSVISVNTNLFMFPQFDLLPSPVGLFKSMLKFVRIIDAQGLVSY